MSWFKKISEIIKKYWSWAGTLVDLVKAVKGAFSGSKATVSAKLEVVGTRTEEVNGEIYLVTEYNDGTFTKKLLCKTDPTGVGGFLDDVSR